jgi:hypothetical protein
MSKVDDIDKLALALPNVEQKPHFGSRSYRAGGKIFIQASATKNEAIFKLSPARQEILFETRRCVPARDMGRDTLGASDARPHRGRRTAGTCAGSL